MRYAIPAIPLKPNQQTSLIQIQAGKLVFKTEINPKPAINISVLKIPVIIMVRLLPLGSGLAKAMKVKAVNATIEATWMN